MMKKLLIMFMMVMMFAATAYADNGNQSEAEIAKAKFDAMVADITGQIEASYKNGDYIVLKRKGYYHKYMLVDFKYISKFYETTIEEKPYIGTIEMKCDAIKLLDYDDKLFETKEAAMISTSNKRWNLFRGKHWFYVFEDPYFNLFVYEYHNGQWVLTNSKVFSYEEDDENSDYDIMTKRGDLFPFYDDLDENKLYDPLDLYLVKNYKKTPYSWYKR